jgi:SAM-dependent methyltransferase
MSFGSEIAFTPGLSYFERAYIRVLGAPVLGLRIRARAILPLLREIDAPRRIADAGSGRGMLTLACARAFPNAQVLGLDLDEQQNRVNVEIVCALKVRNIEFVSHDVLRLNELGAFDAILSTDNLEHLDDDLGCAKVFLRSLNPGGFLIIHVPHLTRHLFGWRRANWMDIEGHVRPGYTRDSLITLLTRAGFQVIRCEYDYNSIQTLASDLSYWITGGHERNKMIYALAFPFLLAFAAIGSSYRPRKDGSGLVALARKPLE